MRTVWRLLTCCIPLILLIGCGPVFRVTKDGAPVQGIPFYVKDADCLHQMVYVMPYVRLTLQTLNGQKFQGAETMTISEKDFNEDTTVQSLLALLRENPLTVTEFGVVTHDWTDIRNQKSANPYEAVKNQRWPQYLVSNSTTTKLFVDYESVYTLNAKSPLVGSVSADYHLASDGTLSEASGQVTDQTLSTILSALPISSLITTVASGGLLKGAATPALAEITVQVVVERRAIRITNSQLIPYEKGCPDTNSFLDSPPLGTLVEDIGADSANSSQSKPDDNSITVSGKITLPKPKDAGSGPAPGAGDATTATPKP